MRRSAIIYNDIFYRNPRTDELNLVALGDEEYQEAERIKDAQRRMTILILDSQFSEPNLRKVFELIKKRFPQPLHLEIEVQTSLAVIETPEEREMVHDSLNTRFQAQENKHDSGYFRRDEDGDYLIVTRSKRSKIAGKIASN